MLKPTATVPTLPLPSTILHSQLMTIDQIALMLAVSPKTIYRWVCLKKIPFIKLQRHLRFQPDAVVEHFRKKTLDAVPYCFQSDLLLKQTHFGQKRPRSLKTCEMAAGSYSKKG